MGMLIQTKGTQFLANFLNAQRFSAANIGTLSGLVKTIFGTPQTNWNSLYLISEASVGQWPTDGSDILYPTATVNTVAASSTSNLTFTSPLPSWVTSANTALTFRAVWDQTNKGAIPNGTQIQSINSTTSLTLTQPVNGVQAGDEIVFSDQNHPNLIKRWKWYLNNDMLPSTHLAMQQAIFQALSDATYTFVNFQVLEDSSQKALAATEYNLKANGKLDFTKKYMNVALLTPPTTAKDSIDPQ